MVAKLCTTLVLAREPTTSKSTGVIFKTEDFQDPTQDPNQLQEPMIRQGRGVFTGDHACIILGGIRGEEESTRSLVVQVLEVK